MLVTGSTRGIGRAVCLAFADSHEIVGVARSGADFNGDLTDEKFRDRLISEISPHVLINNAGLCGQDNSVSQVFELNSVAAIDLMTRFAKKMHGGHIINISSLIAGIGLFWKMPEQEINYMVSKKALSDFSQAFQNLQVNRVKISTIEPGFVMTDFSDIRLHHENRTLNHYMTEKGIIPMPPDRIVSTIRWILSQPEDIIISSVQIMNRLQK